MFLNYLRLIPVGITLRQLASITLLAAMILPISLPTLTLANSGKGRRDRNSESSAVRPPVLSETPRDSVQGVMQDTGMDVVTQPVNTEAVRSSNPSMVGRAKVASIKLNSPSKVKAYSKQRLMMSALPFDQNGNVVNGFPVRWTSSNENVVTINEDGIAMAAKIGTARLTARVSDLEESVRVKVVAKEKNASPKVTEMKHQPRRPLRKAHPTSPLPISSVLEGPIDSMYTSENAVGMPPGHSEVGAPTPDAASRLIRERPGSANFNFSLPLVDLPGRGIGVSLTLTYNSRVWNKSSDSDGTYYTFDVDNNRLAVAPGFSIGYGYIDLIGYGPGFDDPRFSYTDSSGTRHEMIKPTASSTYHETSDGTFIRFYPTSTGGTIHYTDGTKVSFSAPSTQWNRRYPVKITDRNGNYIDVTYVSNGEGRIAWITDTMGRRVNFLYDHITPTRLIGISAPKYNGTTSNEQQLAVRFYYDRIVQPTPPAPQITRFNNGSSYMPNVDIIKYVYFPGTRTGFRYDYYTQYGMIEQITRLASMVVTSESDWDDEGTVDTNQGQEAAWTNYDYPTWIPTGLADVPKYTRRTDDWSGRTSATPLIYDYVVDDTSSTQWRYTKVTGPSINGQAAQTITYTKKNVVNNVPQWNDGLAYQIDVIRVGDGGLFSRAMFIWQQGANGRNHRVISEQNENEVQEKRIRNYEYDAYNNVKVLIENDFLAPHGTGAELRRTEVSFETGVSWINRRLVRLPKEIVVKQGQSIKSKTKYTYDNGGIGTAGYLLPRANLIMHDPTFNPSLEPGEPICTEFAENSPPCTNPNPGQGPMRGNVTKVESFPDATATSGNNNGMKYDIAGNMVEATLNCCQLKTFTFNKDYEYAYPIEAIKRSDLDPSLQLKNSATLDFNTGLVTSTKDANNQTTYIQNDPATLRLTQVVRPDGGYTKFEYFDGLYQDGAPNRMHSYVKSTTRLDSSNREIVSMQYLDGRGAVARTFGTQTSQDFSSVIDIEYDVMGRLWRTSNPYYASGSSAPINPSGKWTSRGYDLLGRVYVVVLADFSEIHTEYAGSITTGVDQANKKRRSMEDALGRVVRVDEPDMTNELGQPGTPTQPTNYEYDILDNLTKVTQTVPGGITQERQLKYDSLSRLTHEKQVEAKATLNDQGQLVSGGAGQWTGVYKYGIWGMIIDAYNSNGVHTEFKYDDPHNRLTEIKYSDGTPTVTYAYDQVQGTFKNKGRLTEVRTAAVAATSLMPEIPQTIQAGDYDMMGRISKQQQTIGSQTYTLEYGYNLASQLVSQKYPSGRTVTYNVDGAGRLSNVADANLTYASGFTYGQHGGRLSGMTYGNGAIETVSYNDRLQVEQLALTKDSTLLQRYDYKYGTYDASLGTLNEGQNTGQIASIESYVTGANGQPDRLWQQRFKYDSIGRLEKVGEYRGDTLATTYIAKYSYDRFGNRFQNPADQVNVPSYVGVLESDVDKSTNRFTTATGIVYDDAGNMTVDAKFRMRQYQYNANGRQTWTKYSDGTGNAAISVYDGSGQRVATQVNGQWTYSVFDAFGQLIAEYGGPEAVGAGGVRYMMMDHQGSTRMSMNSSSVAGSVVVSRSDYMPFGEMIGAGIGRRNEVSGYNATDENVHRYALTERDESTGLDHTLWRKYENKSGRWTSPDPYKGSMIVGDAQSFNRYVYVRNDPINLVDPGGLIHSCDWPDCGYGPDLWGGSFPGAEWGWYTDPGWWSEDNDTIDNGINKAEELLTGDCKAFIEKLLADAVAAIYKNITDQAGKDYLNGQTTSENLISNVRAAGRIIPGESSANRATATTHGDGSQDITYWQGFFGDVIPNQLIINNSPRSYVDSRSTTQNAQSLIHEGLHLAAGGAFSDALLGEIISGKPVSGKTDGEKQKNGSKIINKAVEKNCPG